MKNSLQLAQLTTLVILDMNFLAMLQGCVVEENGIINHQHA